MFSTLANKILISIVLLGVATSVAAHTYFFGISEIDVNSETEHLEIVHQFTTHDIENAIAQQQQIHFSPAHPNYEKLIQQYFELNFTLTRNKSPIKLNWLGIEFQRGQIFAYQESDNKNLLANLLVKNTILIDTYPKQMNTVNYQSLTTTPQLQGSLTFTHAQHRAQISSENQ